MGVLIRGALLAEVAGSLLAEHGVLGSQAGDLCACGVQAGAEHSAVARWAAARVVADRDGPVRMRLIRSRMAGSR